MQMPNRIGLLVFGLAIMPGCGKTHTSYRLVYPNLTFYGASRSSFGSLVSRAGPDGKLADVYIRYSGRTYHLPDLPKRMEDEIRSKPGIRADFDRGRYVYFQADSRAGIEISNRKEGPFYELPIAETDLYKLFGKPKARLKVTSRSSGGFGHLQGERVEKY